MAVEYRLQLTVCFLIARNSSALSFPTDSPHSTSWLFNGGGIFTQRKCSLFLFPSTGFLLCILGDWMAKVLITSESELTSSVSKKKKKKRKITWIVIITDSIYWTQATWLTVGWALCILLRHLLLPKTTPYIKRYCIIPFLPMRKLKLRS